VEIYNPDDQVHQLKAWWKQYGKSLIAGVVIGAMLLGGINYWRQYRVHQAEAASVLYEALLADVQQGRSENAAATSGKLMQDYPATPYAGKAALLAARLRYDARDIAGARQSLEWAMKNATEDAVQHSARLRLGRILLDQNETDAALTLIQVKGFDGFTSEYEELRGDLLLAKGDRDGARRAYQTALAKLPRGSSYGSLLAMKRDNLGPEPKS
jgi:predicted negative regulator of RcsB-dependent stress response